MTPTRPLALLLGADLGGGLLAGCGGVDEALTVESGTADVSGLYADPAPDLAVALTTPGQYLSNDFYTFGGPVEARTDGEVTVVVRSEHVTAYDPVTHEERWRLRVPETVCDGSGVVGGRIALLTGRQGLRGCRRLTLVDAADGSVLWRRDTRDADAYVEDPGVALTRTQVLAVGDCGQVLRFAVDGGGPLGALDDGDCGDSVAVDDGAVVTVRELDGERDGFDLDVTDPTTGRTDSRRTVGPDDGRVNAVLTTDPLVVEIQEDGYRSLQRLDDRGRRLGFLGRSFDPYGNDTDVLVAARVGDVAVLSYKDLPGYRAYDLTTGEELWATDDLRFLAGADGRGLVWVQPVEVAGEDGSGTYQQQVTRTPVEDPATGELLGGLSGPVEVAAVAGADLLVDDGNGIDVVPLPADGTGAAPEPGPSRLDEYAVASPDRQDGDVLPSQVADPCAGIGADTLAAVGLRADVPAPASCRWNVYTLDRPGETSLDVTARAVSPGELPEDGSVTDDAAEEAAGTATGAATQIFDGEARRWEEMDDLGDEARATSRTNDSGAVSAARIRVRSGNVIVEVDASTSGPVGLGGRAVPVEVLEDAVRDAAQDVLDTTLG